MLTKLAYLFFFFLTLAAAGFGYFAKGGLPLGYAIPFLFLMGLFFVVVGVLGSVSFILSMVKQIRNGNEEQITRIPKEELVLGGISVIIILVVVGRLLFWYINALMR